ncbi:MAG TPA: methylaspartate mutase subunit E [Candidatus Brocadiia bacterium]|nr:methylaspartate mutase subunit E [Candidatus Brocadiia bacterium]
MKLEDRKLDLDEFMASRPEVLASWSTGAEAADLEASIAYQAAIPAQKRFSEALRKAEAARLTLTQPRAGVCLPRDHIRLLKRLQDEGEADLLPTTIDSYTRQNRYAEAESGIVESRQENRSLLNGFPVVNHGVRTSREVTEAMAKPVQVRHGTPDARLLCEISLAAGFTAFEGGGVSYNIPYAKNVPLERSLLHWQYVDRLVGLYAERGVIINREPFGPLTGTLVPPCIVNAVGVIEGLLAARQGVKCLTLGYGQCGNLFQDIAAVRVLRKLFAEYLARFGHQGIAVSTAFHQWMGGFPPEEDRAFGVIAWGSVVAGLSHATKVITKTPHEAMGVPTAEANIAGLRSTRQTLNLLARQPVLESPLIDAEAAQIERETRTLIEKTLELGDGDLAQGVPRAFQAGVLDVPFAPSKQAHGAVVPVRDTNGAVRIFEFGRLPFDESIKSVHREALARRAKAEGRAVSFQMVTDDIYAVSKGRLVGTPR